MISLTLLFLLPFSQEGDINMDANNILLQILRNNPQFNAVITEIQKSGKSPKDLFYEKAKEKGVNPDDVLKTLQSFKIT